MRNAVTITMPGGRRRLRRTGGALAAVALGAVLLAACSSSSSSSSATSNAAKPANTTSILIGYENNGADPSMITLHNGYFQKELGSGVQTKLFTSGPAALDALASGTLQFMCGLGLPPVISPISKGVPLEVIFNQERYTTDAGIVVKASSGITSLAGLKGKTIAIVQGSEASFELPTLLGQQGIPLSAVHQLNMSPPEMASAWSTGQIQAAIVWDPVFDKLQSEGGRVLATDALLSPDASSFNICVADKTFVQAHPQAAVDFVKAMGDGVDYMNAHPNKALTIMADEAGISTATAKSELTGYKIYSLADQVTPTVLGSGSSVASSGTTKSLEANWKELYTQGFLPVAPPSLSGIAKYVDPVPDEQALGS
jgi:NitT/TauT family transport system substrate-binding protein/taurine transport system substrate-binding protein